jgi:hypothetical protein
MPLYVQNYKHDGGTNFKVMPRKFQVVGIYSTRNYEQIYTTKLYTG